MIVIEKLNWINRTLIEKFFRKSSQKPKCVHRSNPPNMGLFPTKKTELTPIEKTPNPGILQALFSVSLQNLLRLCENDPLFDRKLLEYLHEQGSGSDQIKPVSGQFLLI